MRKALTLFMALVLAITLFGCSASQTGPSDTTLQNDTTAAEPPSETADKEDTQEDEPTEPTIEPEPIWQWEYDSPESHNLNAAALDALHTQLDNTAVFTTVIIKDGYIVDEYYKDGYDETSLFSLNSCSKSVTGTLIGIAIDQGLIEDVDVLISEYFPQILEGDSEYWKQVTIRHLLTHSSGMNWNESEIFGEWRSSDNWVDFVRGRPMIDRPGTTFSYSTGGSHLLSAILQQATGMTAYDFGKEYLFAPLDMDSVQCGADPQGISDGGNGFIMNVYDMARLGRLFLNGGMWEGEQIVSAKWVEESTSVQFPHTTGTAHHGYQWWVRTFGDAQYDAFFAQGHFGQFIFVIPELDLIAVFTSHNTGNSNMYWRFVSDIVAACEA